MSHDWQSVKGENILKWHHHMYLSSYFRYGCGNGMDTLSVKRRKWWNDDSWWKDQKDRPLLFNLCLHWTASTDLSVTGKIGQNFFLPQNTILMITVIANTFLESIWELFSVFLNISYSSVHSFILSIFLLLPYSSWKFQNTCYLSELLSIVRLVSVQRRKVTWKWRCNIWRQQKVWKCCIP